MFIVGMLSWWYGAGWKQCMVRVRERLASTFDYFSIDLLIKTLFSPYRQISAGKVRGSLSVQFHAWVDRMVSRIIGSIVRTVIIVAGVCTIIVTALAGIVAIIAWALMPIFPLIGIVLTVVGWVPWR